jgi:hypothetical protein
MGTIEKILNLIKMKNESKSNSVELYAEMKLDDGRVIATEDEQFMIGSKVFAVGDDGEAEMLEAGSYTMENGNKMTIGEDSEILDLGEEKEAEDVEAKSEEEEMSEETTEESKEEELADVGDWEGMEKRIQNLEDAVADLKADKVEASSEVVEETEEEKTEMSSEVIGDLMTQIEELKSKIVELSGEPATEGINYNPEGYTFNSTVDLAKLSTEERTSYYINNLK